MSLNYWWRNNAATVRIAIVRRVEKSSHVEPKLLWVNDTIFYVLNVLYIFQTRSEQDAPWSGPFSRWDSFILRWTGSSILCVSVTTSWKTLQHVLRLKWKRVSRQTATWLHQWRCCQLMFAPPLMEQVTHSKVTLVLEVLRFGGVCLSTLRIGKYYFALHFWVLLWSRCALAHSCANQPQMYWCKSQVSQFEHLKIQLWYWLCLSSLSILNVKGPIKLHLQPKNKLNHCANDQGFPDSELETSALLT